MLEVNKKVDVKAGDDVVLVLASGKFIAAVATKVLPGNKVNLKAELGGEELVITSSPFDETGKQPDSWHLPDSPPVVITGGPLTPPDAK